MLTEAELRTAATRDPRWAERPEFLTWPLSALPPPGLLWTWRVEQADAFCHWASACLRRRFGATASVAPVRDDAGMVEFVEVRAMSSAPNEGAEPPVAPVSITDWRRLNRLRWMGSFCVMANRVLLPLGVQAIELGTGGEDTVVAFCRPPWADTLEAYFPPGD